MKTEPIRDIAKFIAMQKKLLEDGKVRECLLVQVMFNTNLRVSDALLMRWRDVCNGEDIYKTFVVKEQKVRNVKRPKPKYIPVSEQLHDSLLNFYYKYKPKLNHYIFRSESNRVIRKNTSWRRGYVYKFIRHYAGLVGIDGNIGSHTLRRSWAYHAYHTEIVPLELIRIILGHRDVRTTMEYAGITADTQREKYELVSQLSGAADEFIRADTLPNRINKFKRKKMKGAADASFKIKKGE